MAGWKLRKDKAQGEASGEETLPEAKLAPEATSAREDILAGGKAPIEMQWEEPAEDWIVPALPIAAESVVAMPLSAEPDYRGEPQHHLTEDEVPAPHFDDDVLPAPNPIAVPEPVAVPEVPIISPTLQFPTPPPAAPGLSGATLRMDPSEMAPVIPSPSGFSIPSVSPFLVVLPKEEIEETPHTLQVRIGRLSATFEMTKEVTVIGRPDSELHFYPDIEIDLDDAVSRRHAEILRHEKDYYLVDAGSTNGTLLNGEMLKPHEERLLAHGDRIRVGERTEIIFE